MSAPCSRGACACQPASLRRSRRRLCRSADRAETRLRRRRLLEQLRVALYQYFARTEDTVGHIAPNLGGYRRSIERTQRLGQIVSHTAICRKARVAGMVQQVAQCLGIEVRQDLIDDEEGVAAVARVMHDVIASIPGKLGKNEKRCTA